MSTLRNCFSAALCAVVLSCSALTASATPIVFNFDSDTPGAYDSFDTVDGLTLGFLGAGTVCDTAGVGFALLSGNALATNACDGTYGQTILMFTSPVNDLSFGFAVSSSDPVEVLFLFRGYLAGTLTLDDNGSGEGLRSFAGTFDTVLFDTAYSNSDYALDNITVSLAPVPEPSSMLLMGTGLMGLAGAVRRHLSA
jgi:hypothetical protein